MNKILILPILLAAAIIPTTEVKAEDLGLRVCEYVAANDKSRLRTLLKQNKIKLRKIYSNFQCNGDSLLVFAAKSNSLKVGEFIIGKLPSKVVKSEIDELAKHSADLTTAARAR